MTNEKVLVAIIAAISAILGGVLTSVISPWIKMKLEVRTKEKERKRALVKEWRNMLLEVQSNVEYENEVGQLIQVHPAYLSLEPFLNKETRNFVYSENRSIIVESALSAPLRAVKDEISRLESEWGIR